jgi:hypothetical protein
MRSLDLETKRSNEKWREVQALLLKESIEVQVKANIDNKSKIIIVKHSITLHSIVCSKYIFNN